MSASPKRRARTSLINSIARLENAVTCIDGIYDDLDEREADAALPGNGGSGDSTGDISDPTAAAAHRIHDIAEQRRANMRAVEGVEKAIEHLRTEWERSLAGRTTSHLSTLCPELVDSHDGYGTVTVACGQITGTKKGASRADRLCDTHGHEYDENERRATDALRNRKKRNAA